MSLEDRITELEEAFQEYLDRRRSGDRLIFFGIVLILIGQVVSWVGA